MSITAVKIAIKYCNEVEFTHQHDTVRSACKEYANLLAEALEPTGKLAEALHIRELAMTLYDKEGWEFRTVESGRFLCAHDNDPISV